MNNIRRLRSGGPLRALLAGLAALLIFGALPALAAGDTPVFADTFPALAAGDTPVAAVEEQDQEAKKILLDMADFIAKTPVFSVTFRSGYDAIQEDGQRIEFGEKRKVLLKRPDRMRVEATRSDGDEGLVIFDGKTITVFKADDKVFAKLEKPGTVDEILVYLVRDLHFTLPMARMFLSEFPQQLAKKMTGVNYVEENALFDVVTDHLAVRSEDVDMQIWIAQGDQPLPRRIILTYKNAPGEPQYRADFLEWTIAPEAGEERFAFTPPADVEQIPLLAPVRQKGSLPPQQGGN